MRSERSIVRIWLLRASRGDRRELLLLPGEQPGAQHAHPRLAVLQLALLVLHRHHDAGRHVGDAHRGVGRVDRLAAGAGRAEHVDLEVVRVDLDLLGRVDLREDEHAGRRGVDAALRLGRRHPLNAVHAALVLEVRPDALRGVGRVRLDRDLNVLVAAEVGLGAIEDLGLPAARLGVVRGTSAARSAANSALSSPPSPPLISMITSRPSSGSRGISSRRSFSWAVARLSSSDGTSSAKASSSRASSRAAARSSCACCHAVWAATIWLSSA